jgi:hypothetical protein
MQAETSNLSYNPNARYDCGPNAAGAGRMPNQATLLTAAYSGLDATGVVSQSTVRTGFNAAGVAKNNGGPNVAGAPRSYAEYVQGQPVVVPPTPT